MQTFLFNLSNFIVNGGLFSMLGSGDGETPGIDYKEAPWYKNVIKPILDILDALLVPLLIIVGTAGSIYAVVLGVNFARAETADKRDEAKKRMINAIIGLVVMILLLVLLKLFTTNAQSIVTWISGVGKTPTTTTTS